MNYIQSKINQGQFQDAANAAASNPELNDLVLELIDQGADNFGHILINAVTGDNDTLVRWILDQHEPISPDDILVAFDEATGACSLNSLRLLLEAFELPRTEWDRILRLADKRIRANSDPDVKRRCDVVRRLLQNYML